MKITSAFDSGNIEVVSIDGDVAELNIRRDTHSDFYQWFHFRVTGGRSRKLAFRITNAGGAAYPKGWEDYRVCVSADRERWRRYPTSYADGVLSFELEPEADSVWVAYYPPYSHERHLDLVAKAVSGYGWDYRYLGETVQGRSMDCVSVGQGAQTAWVIARQHPGESMAEWWMEGFMDRLAFDDPVAVEARERMRFHIVPNMNPDGSALGNLRTNAMGANLNREWDCATPERSPEVWHVRAAMEADPPAFCLDVHGDEALPYNFIAGAEGIPGHTNDQAAQLDRFLNAYKAATPMFQTEVGYPKTAPGKANLAMATNYIGHAHGGLAMTLEMPFKDDANHPDPEWGWSVEKCRELGAAALEAMVDWARSKP